MAGVELPQLVQRLVLDSSGFKRGATEAAGALTTTAKVSDESAKKVEKAWLKSSQGLNDLGRAGLVVGGVLTAAFAASVGAAAKFEVSMRNVSTISEVTRKNFGDMSAKVLELSRVVPQSANVLAEGLYDIASSGFDGAEALTVLEASAVAASAGLTNTATAAKGVTAVLNAYGKSGFEAAAVSDILFQTVNLGVITFEELAQNMGDFVGTAAAFGRNMEGNFIVPVEDAAAALATMTLSGINAAEASTALNRVMLAFIKPSDEMVSTLKAYGYESGVAAVEALGLKGAIELVGRATGGSIQQLSGLFAEVRGLKGALALLSDEGENYTRVANGITDETARMGATQRAFNEQSKSLSFQLEILKSSITGLAVEIGTKALPVLNSIASTATSMVGVFSDLPEPIKVVGMILGGLTAAVALLGGAFLLLAPRINAAKIAFADLEARVPRVAGAIGILTKALGLAGLAFTAITLAGALYSSSKREETEATEAFVKALEQEAQGLDGATDAAIKARLASQGLIGQAARLGVSYDDLTDAIKGNDDAYQKVRRTGNEIVGTLGKQAGALGGLNDRVDAGTTMNREFDGSILRLRTSLAEATRKVEEQEKATNLLMEVTGKSKKELIDLGLATETTGDKIEEAAQSIGLTSKVLAQFGVDSEDAAKAFAKSVQSVMDATAKAFQKDFDVVAKFSESSWEKMKADAEKGADGIVAAEEKLADARQALSDLQDRLAEKTTRSVSDNQQLAKAQEKVTEATEKLAEAQAKGSTALGTMSDEIAKFYTTSLAEAEEFNANISKAIQMGLDPTVVTRLLQEGPKAAAPLLREIVGAHGSSLVEMMNLNEKALSKSGTIAVEIARLTQLAVSSKSGQMVKELKDAMRIAQIEADSGGTATIGSIAVAMERSYSDIKGIVDRFGIVVPESLTAAGKKSADGFTGGLSPIVPSAENFLRAIGVGVKDHIGPIPPEMTKLAGEIASGWKAGISPMPEDTNALMFLLDQNMRGKLDPLPGYTTDTANDLAVFWRVGLDPMPRDTDERANNTARILKDALEPLPGATRETATSLVGAWLRELAKGEAGTSAETAAWARAMLAQLNPLLEGVGATPVYLDQTEGRTAAGVQMAQGGLSERHDATVAKAGSPMRLWAEPETQGEAYIPLAPAKRRRSTGILNYVAERFGYGLVPMAFGGVTDEEGLPVPFPLDEYGRMVGYTGEEGVKYTYAGIKGAVAEKKAAAARAAAAAAAASSGGGVPYSGSGSIGSGWQQITGYLDSKGQGYQVTSTYRPGDPGFHGQGKAVDMVGDMAAIFNTLAGVPGINELFYDPMGYSYDEGQRVGWTVGDHDDHVHAATFDKGGTLLPGWTLAYNGTGKPERVLPLSHGGVVRDESEHQSWMASQPNGIPYQDFEANSLSDPNRGRAGWIQDFGGTWVPEGTKMTPIPMGAWVPGAGYNPPDDDSFESNHYYSPHKDKPGYFQFEDGTWARNSDGSMGPPRYWRDSPSNNYGPNYNGGANLQPPPVNVPSTPRPPSFSGFSGSYQSAGHDGGVLDLNKLADLIEEVIRSVLDAVVSNPLRAYVLADEIEAVAYQNWRSRQ